MAYPDSDKAYLRDSSTISASWLCFPLKTMVPQQGTSARTRREDCVAWNYPADLAEVIECHTPHTRRVSTGTDRNRGLREAYSEVSGLGLFQTHPRFHRPTAPEIAAMLCGVCRFLGRHPGAASGWNFAAELQSMLVCLTGRR